MPDRASRKRPSLAVSPTTSPGSDATNKRQAGARGAAAATAAPSPRPVTITVPADEGAYAVGALAALHEQQRAGKLCDVLFVVDGRRFPAHRNVMAACSPHLAALLTGDMQEATAPEIQLQEIDADAFRSMVSFAYTGRLQVLPGGSAPNNLLQATRLLQVLAAEKACCEFLASGLDANNCGDIALMAEHFSCTGLLARVEHYLRSRFAEVVDGSGLLQLPLHLFSSLVSSDRLVTPEDLVYRGVLRWVKHDLTARKRALGQLLPLVRFGQLSQDAMAELKTGVCEW